MLRSHPERVPKASRTKRQRLHVLILCLPYPPGGCSETQHLLSLPLCAGTRTANLPLSRRYGAHSICEKLTYAGAKLRQVLRPAPLAQRQNARSHSKPHMVSSSLLPLSVLKTLASKWRTASIDRLSSNEFTRKSASSSICQSMPLTLV